MNGAFPGLTSSFGHPERLWALLVLAPWALLAALGARRRERDWGLLGQPGRPRSDGSWSWLWATGLLIVALAQPRWGRTGGQDSPPGHDLVLLVDASRSMGAEDAVPDRMGVAIASGISLIEALRADPGNRAAIVAFAGRGVARCPLTGDLDAALDALRAIQPGEVEPGGTDLGSGLEAALAAFDDEDHAEGRAIVILSDGEDHAGRWSVALEQLRAEGIVVHSVAIGDAERDHDVPDRSSAIAGKKSDPRPRSRRSDVAFEALAKATGGALIPIGLAPVDLGSLYRERIEPTARRNRDEFRIPERVERFPIFVLSALTIGLAGSWPGRSRRRHASRTRRRIRALAGVISLGGLLGAGQGGESAAELVARGRVAYDSGRFPEALASFDRARSLSPRSPIPGYDSAAALFRLRRFPEAIARYGEARASAGSELLPKIDFALGNAHLAIGDLATALTFYDACIASTDPGPGSEAVRRDAAINRAFVAERIKPPPPPPEPEGSGGGNPAKNRPSAGRGQAEDGQPRTGQGSPGDRPGGSRGSETSPPNGGRGEGGAGGEGEANPEPGSPGARLNEALQDVRESRRQRPPDASPRGPAAGGKDW